jgi:hypothetical protein
MVDLCEGRSPRIDESKNTIQILAREGFSEQEAHTRFPPAQRALHASRHSDDGHWSKCTFLHVKDELGCLYSAHHGHFTVHENTVKVLSLGVDRLVQGLFK